MRTGPVACTSLFALVLLACGGSPPPSAAGPGAADAGVEPDAAAATPVESEHTPVQAGSGGPASDDDVNAILQLVVEDPELDRHLHLGEPGRFPLKIAGSKLPSTLKLVKATEPVKVSEPPQSKKDAVLVITELEIQGDKAIVRYRYDVEGIRATVTLSKRAHGWELKNSRLVEH